MTDADSSRKSNQFNFAMDFAIAGATTVGILTAYYIYKWLPKRPSPEFEMFDGFHPIWGHTVEFGKHLDRLHDWRSDQVAKKDPDIIVTCLPDRNIYTILDPKLIRFIYEDNFDKIERGSAAQAAIRDVFGKGIFNADKPGWKLHRKIASRLLTIRNLKYTMFENFKDVSQRLCVKLREMSGGGEPVDLADMFLRLTMDGFVTSAFGVTSTNIEDTEETRFSQSFKRAFDCIVGRAFTRPFWKIEKWLNVGRERLQNEDVSYLRNFCDQVVEQNRRLHQEKEVDTKSDLLSLFMKHLDDGDCTPEMIQDICLNFIIAGRDTTGTLLAWFMYELERNQDVYEKVMEEINQIDEITYENVSELSYMESAMLESLRLHPSVPTSNGMTTIEDIILPDGRVIPKNNNVNVFTYAMGRNPRMYKDPLKFDPTRFSQGIKSFPETFYTVFSLGRRICLGRQVSLMEAKVCAWYFLKNFVFESAPETMVVPDISVILFMKNGYNVFLRPKMS